MMIFSFINFCTYLEKNVRLILDEQIFFYNLLQRSLDTSLDFAMVFS